MATTEDILRDILARHGVLDARTVVDDARGHPEHPLYHRLEWDDAVGGEDNRLRQAAQIIRSVKITYTTRDEVADVRAFLAVPVEHHPTQRHYLPTEDVARDPFLSRLTLQEADREWRHFRARYGHLAEFMARVADDAGGLAGGAA